MVEHDMNRIDYQLPLSYGRQIMTVTFIQKGKVDDFLLNLKINKKTEASFITNTYV